MYTSFSIENFRLFDQLTVEPLARVNLIAGQNNAGKTALLEAIWLHSLPNPRTAQQLGFLRGLPISESEVLFADLFRGYQTDLTIRIDAIGDFASGLTFHHPDQRPMPILATALGPILTGLKIFQSENDFDNGVIFEYSDVESGAKFESRAWLNEDPNDERRTIRRRFQVSGEWAGPYFGPCVFIPTGTQPMARDLAIKFGQVEVAGRMDGVQTVLGLVEPRLRRLTAIPKAEGVAQIHGDVGIGRIIPVSLMGDGFRRLLNLVLSFNEASNGVILVDEIENGIHYSVMQSVWEAIIRFSQEFNVQVFATTHSYECIVAANNAFNTLESDELHLHHMYKRDETVKSQTYNKDAIETNIEYFWELR